MVKKLFSVIFISVLIIGCDNHFKKSPFDPNDGDTGSYYLTISSNLEMGNNGYYSIEWGDYGYGQSFSTLSAETGSNSKIQKVMWSSNSGINESYTDDWVSCVNPASYTDDGIAHTVLSVWENMIGDTIVIYATFVDENNKQYYDSIEVIVKDEI